MRNGGNGSVQSGFACANRLPAKEITSTSAPGRVVAMLRNLHPITFDLPLDATFSVPKRPPGM